MESVEPDMMVYVVLVVTLTVCSENLNAYQLAVDNHCCFLYLSHKITLTLCGWIVVLQARQGQ